MENKIREVAPMCVCWKLFSNHYKEILCVLAGFTRIEYLNFIHEPWEHINEPRRNRIMAVIQQTIIDKECAA